MLPHPSVPFLWVLLSFNTRLSIFGNCHAKNRIFDPCCGTSSAQTMDMEAVCVSFIVLVTTERGAVGWQSTVLCVVGSLAASSGHPWTEKELYPATCCSALSSCPFRDAANEAEEQWQYLVFRAPILRSDTRGKKLPADHEVCFCPGVFSATILAGFQNEWHQAVAKLQRRHHVARQTHS